MYILYVGSWKSHCESSDHLDHFKMTKEGYLHQQLLLSVAIEFTILANITLEFFHRQYFKVKGHAIRASLVPRAYEASSDLTHPTPDHLPSLINDLPLRLPSIDFSSRFTVCTLAPITVCIFHHSLHACSMTLELLLHAMRPLCGRRHITSFHACALPTCHTCDRPNRHFWGLQSKILNDYDQNFFMNFAL